MPASGLISFFATVVIFHVSPACARLGAGKAAVGELTDGTFDRYVTQNEKVLIDFYDDPEQQAELTSALQAVREYGSQVAFAKVDAAAFPDLGKKYVQNGRFPQLVWFLHGQPTSYHRRLRQAQHIASFAIALDREPMMTVTSLDEVPFNPAVFSTLPKASPMHKKLEIIASKHMDTVAFAHMNGRGQNISWIANDAVVETYDGPNTLEDLEHWVNVQLTISEDIPDDIASDEGEMMVVVGKTFEELVLKNDKDVFMMVYAPWVGYSRKLFPVWNAFAREVSDVEHLVVAKMDGDRNRSPFLNVDAFPSLMYFRAGNTTPTVFHGNRTVEELVEFASTHGSQPIQPASLSLMQTGLRLVRSGDL